MNPIWEAYESFLVALFNGRVLNEAQVLYLAPDYFVWLIELAQLIWLS